MSVTPPVPPIQSPTRSALVSISFTVWTLLVVVFTFAAADGMLDTFQHFVAWFGTHWWAMLVSLIINPAPIYRAQQAIINAQKGNIP